MKAAVRVLTRGAASVAARRLRAWAATAACLAAACACADEVVLRNGDCLSGQIRRLAGGTLVLKTPYAGKLNIDWKEVATLTTDQPVYIVLDDENRIHAVLDLAEEGSVALRGADWLAAAPVALERIASLTRRPVPVVTVSGRVNIGASSTSGNTDTEQLHADAEAVARSAKNRFTFGGVLDRAKNAGVETEWRSRAYLKYDHFAKRLYGYANTDLENDRFKDIKLRTTLGFGAGYQFFESKEANLSVELGLNYVNTDFETAPDEGYPAIRWALKFDHYVFRSKAQFFHEQEAFFGMDSSENVFARSRTGFRFPVIERLNATVQYNLDWDKSPAPGRFGTDRSLLFTLGYFW